MICLGEDFVYIKQFERNIYSEKSKADDVQFILDLIAKIAAEVPQADMDNVNIAGRIFVIKFIKAIIIRNKQWSWSHISVTYKHWS